MSERLDAMVNGRKRARGVAGLRGLANGAAVRPAPPLTMIDVMGQAAQALPNEEACDLCGRGVPEEHRHMLDLEERRIVCTCEGCWALRSGEPRFAPVGHRTLWLEDFALPEDVWASFGVPIGLAFFMFSSVTSCVVAMYPSPAGATESELHFADWQRLTELNPVLETLEPDCEALIVNRMADPPLFAIAPIDRAYELVGLIKRHWDGISGGAAVETAVAGYFEGLRAAATA
jgi:hypothetical protein